MAGTDAKHQALDDNAIPTRRRSRWWIPVLTFVAGIAVGVLIVGLLNTSTPDFSATISVETLSVSSAKSGSPSFTNSPDFLCQAETTPLVTDSPTDGTFTSIIIAGIYLN